jgi:hypothetical protein
MRMSRNSTIARSVLCLLWLGAGAGCGGGAHQQDGGGGGADGSGAGDFRQNWRAYVSQDAVLAQPVAIPAATAQWDPGVFSNCATTADGSLDTEITLTWNDPASGPPGPEATDFRLDLSLFYRGLETNKYASVLASAAPARLMLPSNSVLIDDLTDLFLVGAGLFPELTSVTVQGVQDRDSGQRFNQTTVVLLGFNGGVSYTMRLDRPAAGGQGWTEDRRTVFSTPICPTSF